MGLSKTFQLPIPVRRRRVHLGLAWPWPEHVSYSRRSNLGATKKRNMGARHKDHALVRFPDGSEETVTGLQVQLVEQNEV